MNEDLRLIQAARNEADKQAFAKLVERNRRLMYAAAYSVLRSRDEAEDITQEAIYRIFANLNSFREDCNFKSWAYAIARNAALARLRSRAREVQIDGTLELQGTSEDGAASEVRDALNELPPRLREPLLLYYVDGYTSREAAEILGVASGTVRARLTEARRSLRKELLSMLKRAVQELVPPAKLSELLNALQILPKTQPDMLIVEADGPLPDPDFREAHWNFVPLESDGEAVTANYDYPERALTDVWSGKVLGMTQVAGQECYEVMSIEPPIDDPTCYGLSYWTVTDDQIILVGVVKSNEDRMILSTDPDWDWGAHTYPRYPARQALVRRLGEEEFADLAERTLSPVGAYDVTVGERTWRCLRAFEASGGGVLVEAYVNQAGRTVLWRRYNALPEWSSANVRGPYQTPGAVERLRESGNQRIVFNGVEYYHWYDCMTDVVLDL